MTAAETLKLERTLSDLVNQAYALTPAGLSPPGSASPYTYEPCQDVEPMPDYENALTD